MPPALSDRAALQRFRKRALSAPALFLHEDAADEVQERLEEVKRVFTAPAVVTPFPQIWQNRLPNARLVADDPVLDLEVGAHDLVIHALSLHWADDLLGQIIQCRRALKPDGLFIGVMFGGQSLNELRSVLAQAESDVTGGMAPRIVPMGEIRDLGALLQRAGLALPVADGFKRSILYRNMPHLLGDLRGMGESNALANRHRAPLSRGVMNRAETLYQQAFSDAEGRLKCTVETLFLTGWSPSDTQQQPLRPGSAVQRLADALGATETPLEPAPIAAPRPAKD